MHIYITRLLHIALERYVFKDRAIPVDLEAKLIECGIDTNALQYT